VVRARSLTLCLALACAGPPADEGGVVTTLVPLAFLAQELVEGALPVASLVPPGASPHAFEPRPSDVARLERARLFVRLDSPLDAWAERLRAGAPPGLRTVSVFALEGLDARPDDPHVWLDPLRVRDVIAPALAEALAAGDPGAGRTRARLADFQARLTRLDAEIRALLSRAPSRRYVAFHNAWRYFGERYGLEEVGVVHEYAGEEPTPRALASLVAAARAARVPAILVEPQLDPRVARTLAKEFGATTVLVDPLGDPTVPERATYEALLRFDARAFARALGGAAQ
jgi:ABC-type Zn uptake system ZnuABC Zn-binding protein ZnuA